MTHTVLQDLKLIPLCHHKPDTGEWSDQKLMKIWEVSAGVACTKLTVGKEVDPNFCFLI